jgi:hypothetical protein
MSMPASITDEQWQPIDEAIFANLKLPAFKQIRALTGCSLKESLDLFYERYAKLRAEAPDRFDCTDQEYWAGFCS